jgi:hypothetical protein
MSTIDRRQFLGLFSAAALSSIAPFDRLVQHGRSRFSSPALSFSFDIPAGWNSMSVEEIIRNRDSLVYVEENRASDELSPTPMIAFSRYREPCPNVNPGVCIYADRRADWMGDDVASLADSITEYFSSIVRNAQISRAIDTSKIHRCESAKSEIIYDLVCSNGFRYRVIDYFLLARHREHLIFLQFEQSLDQTERADKEFGEIERTMQFD